MFLRLVLTFLILVLLSCTNHQALPKATGAEIQSLKSQVITLQQRLDSLLAAMEPRRPADVKKNKRGSTKKVKAATIAQLSSAYNWQTANTPSPVYKKAKKQETYRVRTGAICYDGSRSYATGRGACSHHGGVREWLYE